MKIFNLFLVALTIFGFISPANAQKQKVVKTPLVPCSIPIENSPSLRGARLGLPIPPFHSQIIDGVSPFITHIVINPPQKVELPRTIGLPTPQPTPPPFLTPEILRALDKIDSREFSKYASKTPAESTNNPENSFNYEGVKKIDVSYYGRGEPRSYKFEITYDDGFIFENEDELKQLVADNLKISAGSFITIQDPELLRKLFQDVFGMTLLLTFDRPNPDLKFWQADCSGWRAVFFTTIENKGLTLSVMNSYVVDNLPKLQKDSDDEVRKWKIEQTKKKLKKL